MEHSTKSAVTLIGLQFSLHWTGDCGFGGAPERILEEKVECSVWFSEFAIIDSLAKEISQNGAECA